MDNVRERVDALQRVGESSLRARGITPEALEKQRLGRAERSRGRAESAE